MNEQTTVFITWRAVTVANDCVTRKIGVSSHFHLGIWRVESSSQSSTQPSSPSTMSFMQHTPYSSFNSARGLTAAQAYGDTPPPLSAPSLAPPTPLQQTLNNFGMFGVSSIGHLPPQQQHLLQQEENKIYALVIDLLDANAREAALLELSKKREQYDDLALVLWHSFGEHNFDCNTLIAVLM